MRPMTYVGALVASAVVSINTRQGSATAGLRALCVTGRRNTLRAHRPCRPSRRSRGRQGAAALKGRNLRARLTRRHCSHPQDRARCHADELFAGCANHLLLLALIARSVLHRIAVALRGAGANVAAGSRKFATHTARGQECVERLYSRHCQGRKIPGASAHVRPRQCWPCSA